MSKVPGSKVVTSLEAGESPLPAQIQDALGERRAAREGLLALSVRVGLVWSTTRVHAVRRSL